MVEPNKKPEEKKELEQSLPPQLEEKSIKTVVTSLSDLIKQKLLAMKDLATLEVFIDVPTRMRHRLETIKKMSQANSIKVRGHWKTTPPQIHISKLEGKKISNDEADITFGVYEVDKKGKKVLYENKADVELHDGSKIKRTMSAQYRISHEVTEKIRSGKAITREVIKIDRVQG